jgi:hypothetical protein
VRATQPHPHPLDLTQSSTHSTPRPEPEGTTAKRTRRERINLVGAATRQVGHDYNRPIAKGGARVHYGDNFHNYNGSYPRPSKTPDQVVEHVMESLGFAQMDTRRDTISRAHIDTCKWLFDKQEYLDWRNKELVSAHSDFFWIKSKPAAGKSTLMKYMVNSAKKRMPQDTTISFFFNARGGIALETSLEGMYRSLLHQLLTAFPALQTGQRLAKTANCGRQAWQVQTLEALFSDAMLELEQGHCHLTCFIDALDECTEDDVRKLLKSLGHLSYSAQEEGIDLRVCFSSRHYPNITFEKCQHLNLDGQEGKLIEGIYRKFRKGLVVSSCGLSLSYRS